MENVLFINACVRPDSRTRILAQEVLDCQGQPYTEVDLNREQYPAMDRQALELREDLRRTELRTHPRFGPGLAVCPGGYYCGGGTLLGPVLSGAAEKLH